MEPIQYSLSNGIKVILLPNHAAPVVACNVWVGVGSADETAEEAGLAHVHEHMLFKGTSRRKVGEIAREVEAAGGHINAFTSFDQTCYYVVLSSRFMDQGLDILADAVQHSSFDAGELARELEVIQEEIKRGEDSPSRVATLKLFETAYREHPYRLPVIGTRESVDSFEREDVLRFFEKHYVPENLVVVLVGDFAPDEAKEKIEAQFGAFQGAGYTPVERPAEPEQTSFRGFVNIDDIQEAHLRIGFHIPDAIDEDIPALDMLSIAMGYGDASHLVQVIRREKQMVNSIYASAYTPKETGLFMISADYQLDDAKAADEEFAAQWHRDLVRQVTEEIFRFREMQLNESDIARARTMLESQAIYGRQTVEGLAMKLGHFQMVTGDPLFEEQYYERLAKVTSDDIKRVARKYLKPSNASIVLYHPENTGSIDVKSLQKATEDAFEKIQSETVDGAIATDEQGFLRLEIPDGPTIVLQEDHTVETVSVRALTMGGLRVETKDNNGISQLLAEMITLGTHTRSAPEIAHGIESMAGSLSGISGRNSFGLAMTSLTRFFEPSFALFSECLLDPSLPKEEFDREQQLQLQTIRSRLDSAAAVNYDQFAANFFGPHPYAMPTVGSAESISGLTVEKLQEFYRLFSRPGQYVLSVVGDIQPERVVSLVERYMVRPDMKAAQLQQPAQVERGRRPCQVVRDLEKQQAHLTIGFEAPLLKSDDRYALEVLYAVLSGQGGRLFYELRDRQSLAYSVYATSLLGLEASTFAINIGTSPEKIEQAIEGMVGEVQKLHEEGVTGEEIERAKVYLIGNHDIGLQRNSSRAMSFALDELYELGYKRSMQYADAISDVSRGDIDRIIENYLDFEQTVCAITKPAHVQVGGNLFREALPI